MSKHTPGPWRIRPNDECTKIVDEKNHTLAHCTWLSGFFRRPDEEVLANARLIAAAPALLEACHAMLPFCTTKAQMLDAASLNEGQACGFDVASQLVRAAISAATAESEGKSGKLDTTQS